VSVNPVFHSQPKDSIGISKKIRPKDRDRERLSVINWVPDCLSVEIRLQGSGGCSREGIESLVVRYLVAWEERGQIRGYDWCVDCSEVLGLWYSKENPVLLLVKKPVSTLVLRGF